MPASPAGADGADGTDDDDDCLDERFNECPEAADENPKRLRYTAYIKGPGGKLGAVGSSLLLDYMSIRL